MGIEKGRIGFYEIILIVILMFGIFPSFANILNKQPRTNDKGWSSSLEIGRGANNPSP
jgi:hypothetical protein